MQEDKILEFYRLKTALKKAENAKNTRKTSKLVAPRTRSLTQADAPSTPALNGGGMGQTPFLAGRYWRQHKVAPSATLSQNLLPGALAFAALELMHELVHLHSSAAEDAAHRAGAGHNSIAQK